MKMNIIKHIATAAIPAALLLTSLTAAAQNYPEGSYRVVGGIGFNKHVTDNHDGSFTVDLESFVTGKIHTETKKVPSDIAMILDISASMTSSGGTDLHHTEVTKSVTEAGTRTWTATSREMTGTEHLMTATNPSDGWRYNDFPAPAAAYPQYFYLKDGVYYQVKRETLSSPARYLFYVDLPEGKRYLYGNEPTATAPTAAVAAATRVYFGELYSGAWRSNQITAATTAGGHYILYQEKYYPLLKDGYQVYFVFNGSRKYLTINGVSDTAPASVTNGYCLVYNGELYTGGWSYTGITTDGTANGGRYYLYNDEYYPVVRETVSGNYQAYITVNNNKLYLSGDDVSSTPPTAAGTELMLYYGDLYTAGPSNGWTYANLTIGNSDVNTTLLYKHSDKKYYPVIKKTEGGIRQAYVNLPEGTKYLNPSGALTDTPYPNATTDNVVLYSGTLYKGGWRSIDITPGAATSGHYLLYEGEYYPLIKETATGLTNQVYVNLPEGKRYLAGYTVSPDPYPTTTGGTYSTIYFEPLYVRSSTGYNRAEGLRRAVDSFIDALAESSERDNLDHRLALIKFNRDRWKVGTSNATRDYPYLLEEDFQNVYSHILRDFRVMTNSTQVAELKTGLPNPIPAADIEGGSYYGRGLSLAKGLFNRELGPVDGTDINNDRTIQEFEKPTLSGTDHDEYAKRPKIVIVVGDCEFTAGSYAVDMADDLKAMGAKIFVVRVNSGDTGLANARSIATSNDMVVSVSDYDETLIEALMSITDEIGGEDLEVEGTVVTVDVVSKAFDIPKGEDVSKPTVLVANLTGKREGTSWDPAPLTTGVDGDFVFYTFGTPVVQDVTVDPTTGETPSGIKLVETTDAEGNEKLEVTGFDYSAHWCGPDNKTSSGYHQAGQKLILRFTVVPNEAAVGGPEVQTNEEESGIWVSDPDDPDTKIKIATFNQPSVSLPVNLWIEKQGLTGDDSAVFTIYYADPSAPANAGKSPHEMTYQSFTKVIVHAKDMVDGKALVKITGLDSKSYYKIKEDAWAWSYDDQTGEM